MENILWLEDGDESTPFPSPFKNYTDPDGLLAAGGSLSSKRLLQAYRHGIFPWFDDHQPILWWSPNPRAVLFPEQIKISRSLKKVLKRENFFISHNQDFNSVIHACAAPRAYAESTWITADMQAAYIQLHQQGHAHSVEVWDENGDLVAGLYGVLIDKVFCGESMFHRKTDMSKVATVALTQWCVEKGIGLIDCQIPNPHLTSLGAIEMPKRQFLSEHLGLNEADFRTLAINVRQTTVVRIYFRWSTLAPHI